MQSNMISIKNFSNGPKTNANASQNLLVDPQNKKFWSTPIINFSKFIPGKKAIRSSPQVSAGTLLSISSENSLNGKPTGSTVWIKMKSFFKRPKKHCLNPKKLNKKELSRLSDVIQGAFTSALGKLFPKKLATQTI